METINQKLISWVIGRIEREYKDDVCLLIGHDALKLEIDTEGPSFEYFVPANEKAYSLAKTFIISGIGYDLYPRSWEQIESMAGFDNYNPTCLDHAQILYCRNDEDKTRFLAYQAKLRTNLGNREFMYGKALERLNVAMEIYQTMMFEDSIGKVRMAAGFIADYLSVAVAFINQTYFKYSQIKQMEELSAMKDIPESFIQYYNAIIHAGSVDELKKLSHAMIFSARKFINCRKPPKTDVVRNTDFHGLADWYQELCYTWRRIYHWCDRKDVGKVFVWSCFLQHELDIVKEEYGLKEMDLLGRYNAEQLGDIRKRAEELEKYIVSEIAQNSVVLEIYDTVEDFVAKNP